MNICLFDIDGTLIDTGGAGKHAMQHALAAAFSVPPDADGVVFAGRTDRAIVSDLFQRHKIEDNDRNWLQFRETFVQCLPDHLRSRQGRILTGVVGLLDLLVGRSDVVLGLLTGNLREGARLKLGHYGLYEYFTSGDGPLGAFGDHHRDRDHVARAAIDSLRERFGQFDAERTWIVGDTPADIQCARAVSARAVATATGTHSVDQLKSRSPDLLLENLSEPSAFLNALDG